MLPRLLVATGVGALIASLALAFMQPLHTAALQDTHPLVIRASVSSGGIEAFNGESKEPAISQDGRFVSFVSGAANLVDGDTNGFHDCFVRDLVTHSTIRVSVSTLGAQGNGNCGRSGISRDGRFIVFQSDATNLTADATATRGIFVRDRVLGSTSLASVASDGTPANGPSVVPAISADGRYIAFQSAATNLVPGDTNGWEDVFVHELGSGQTRRISVATGGAQGNQMSGNPSLSDDGRFIVFSSFADNLVHGDTNVVIDVFVHDAQFNRTTRVSVADDESEANGGSLCDPGRCISGDGRVVVFDSAASNLVIGDTNALGDVFVRDLLTTRTELVSLRTDNTHGHRASSGSISSDGESVAFQGYDLVLPAASFQQVYLRDRKARMTSLVSISENGGAGNAHSFAAVLTADGSAGAFFSAADDLIGADFNGQFDVFVTSPLRAKRDGPDLAVVQELTRGQAAPRVSGSLRYRLWVRNAGNQATLPPPNTVTLIDTPPAGTNVASWSLIKGSGNCSVDGAGRLVCSLGANWGPGQETVVEVVIRTPRGGVLTNTVEVDPFRRIIEREEGNNRATLATVVP